jgi:PAS domain S-box-containing protein
MSVNEKGLILEANLTAATLLDLDRNELVKQPLSRFIRKEDQDIYYHHRKRLFDTGEPQVCELRLVRANSPPFWVRLDTTVVQDRENKERLSRTTIIDITDRKRMEDALLEAEQSVRRLNENILNMVMILSHDIRSPIVIIGSALKLMLRGEYGALDSNLSEMVQYLITHTARMLGTADEYLGKAAVIEGPIKMETELLDLRQDIVDVVLDELTESITMHNVNIDNNLPAIPAGSIPIHGNKTWLKAVYRNLFSNAIKYGGRGCTISFGLEPCESHYRLNVHNSGEPIAEENHERLFNRFGRIRITDGPLLDGLGLGLFFTREIIRAHGGEIWYEAQPSGSNFVFTLPMENHGQGCSAK